MSPFELPPPQGSRIHNAFLEIIGSYGFGTVIGFTAFFFGLLRFSIQEKDDALRNQIIILLFLMLAEAVISIVVFYLSHCRF